MKRATAWVIVGTSVSASPMKISDGKPSILGDDPFFMFSSAVLTKSSLSGRRSRGATGLTLAGRGSDARYSIHSGTVLDLAATILAQCACTACAIFWWSTSKEPYLSLREVSRRRFCSSLTSLAISILRACLSYCDTGSACSARFEFVQHLRPTTLNHFRLSIRHQQCVGAVW